MADQNIRFNIGSAFQGEGFEKARQAVASVNNNVKGSIASATRLAGAFGEMDASAAKAMQAATGLIGALATMNITAISTQALMMGINLYFDEMRQKADECRKRVDELAASVQKAFSRTLAASVQEVRDEIKEINDSFDRATKQIQAFSKALDGVRGSNASGEIINLEIEKLNKILEAHGEAEVQNIEAAYNLKIAIEKRANVETEWALKLDEAHAAVLDAEDKVANIDAQIAVIGQRRAELSEVMLSARESGDKNWIEIQAKVNELAKQEAALEQAKIDKEAELDVLRQNEIKAKQDGINATNQATAAVLQVEIANKNAAVAAQEKKVRDEAARDAAAEAAAAQKLETEQKEILRDVEKEAADAQRKATKAATELEKAQRDYKNALDAYNANIVQNMTNEKIQAFIKGGGLNQIGNRLNLQDPAIQAAAAEAAIAAGIADGSVRTLAQANQAGKAAARAARDYASSKQARQEAQDARHREQLQKEADRAAAAGRKLDERKQAELDRLNQLQAGKDKQKADLAAAEKAQKEAALNVQKATKTLENIEKKIDKLTVK